MNKINRRNFMKIAGIAAITPTALLKGKAEGGILRAGLEFPKGAPRYIPDCELSVYKAEPFSLESEDYIEIEIDCSDIFEGEWSIDLGPISYKLGQ